MSGNQKEKKNTNIGKKKKINGKIISRFFFHCFIKDACLYRE